eukprot:TRINITY_DN837_c0_g1_i1.p1 TRINITY_DN837_c0_g1~~TRINITY_DN837_c0_g1_i1.p1  ORF type:complete len:356 (+),score=89.48 TRINITY_DN837_c0_g1_i1:37-1104(+)
MSTPTVFDNELMGRIQPAAGDGLAPVVLSSPNSRYFAELIAQKLNLKLLELIVEKFPDSETYYRIGVNHVTELVRRDVIFVCATHTDDDLLTLYRVGSQLAEYGARRRFFVIPYFGYSTMERAVRRGEIVTAKQNCRLLSSIPNLGLGNVFLFLDLHVNGILHYFEGPCLRFELYGERTLMDAIKELEIDHTQLIMGSADLGRPAWVQSFARHLGCGIVLVRKERNHDRTFVRNVIGDCEGKVVVIFDDMIRSGGTLMKAASAYKANGATKVYALISHFAVPTVEIVQKIEDSELEKLICTNSHPMTQHPAVQRSNKIIVTDATTVFCEMINNCVFSNETIDTDSFNRDFFVSEN